MRSLFPWKQIPLIKAERKTEEERFLIRNLLVFRLITTQSDIVCHKRQRQCTGGGEEKEEKVLKACMSQAGSEEVLFLLNTCTKLHLKYLSKDMCVLHSQKKKQRLLSREPLMAELHG